MAAPTAGVAPDSARVRGGMRPRLTATWLFEALLVALAGAYLVLFLGAGLLRIGYPFPLDPTEAPALTEVQRVLRGEALYVAPTLEYVPLIYGPVYFYLAALVAGVIGPTFTALRVVSFLASLGSLTLVFLLVQRETGSSRFGLAASGFLAGCTALMDTALDIGRVDATFVFFLLAGAYAARHATSQARLGLAGVSIGLAAMAKVPSAAAPIALGLGIYLSWILRARAAVYFAALLGTTAAVVLLLTVQSGTWPAWYMLDLPFHHAPGRDLLARFWLNDLLPRATLPLVLGPLFLVGAAVRGERRAAVFVGVLGLSMLGVAWASRMNGGGAPNVLLPAFAALAVFFGLGIAEGIRQLGVNALQGRAAFRCYVLGVCAVQFVLLVYNPRSIVPFRSDQWADEKLSTALAAVPGPIFAPDFAGYLPPGERQTQPFMSGAAELWGLYGGGSRPQGDEWLRNLHDSISQHRFQSIVLKIDDPFLKDLVEEAGYVNRGPLIPQNDEFYSWRTPRTPQPLLYVNSGT